MIAHIPNFVNSYNMENRDIMRIMQGKTSSYHQILEEICQENQIDLTWLSSDWLAVMQRDGQERHVLGYGKFDLNPAASSMAADDKYVTFEILRQKAVPVIEHAMLYQNSTVGEFVEGRNTPEYIAEYFAKHNQRIVIKPNAGQCGMGVSLVTALDQVPAVLEEVFWQSFSASMCPFYNIAHEYRVIMLDGEARLIYQKNRQDDNWKFNLSQGATVSRVDDEDLWQELTGLAQRAARAIGLRFCSVDIIRDAESHNLLIIEINSGVATAHYLEQFPEDYAKVKAIYRDAVLKMFCA